jgi:hypothetical protein
MGLPRILFGSLSGDSVTKSDHQKQSYKTAVNQCSRLSPLCSFFPLEKSVWYSEKRTPLLRAPTASPLPFADLVGLYYGTPRQ